VIAGTTMWAQSNLLAKEMQRWVKSVLRMGAFAEYGSETGSVRFG
jgi:hypothetical protein